MQAQTTRWSLIFAARGSGVAARDAMASLCKDYRVVVLGWFRRHGPPAEAEDRTQDFLVHVLEHRLFERADAARGSFRAFLQTALKHHWLERLRADSALKRHAPLTQDDDAVSLLADQGHSPEQAFDRDWALHVLARAREALDDEVARGGNTALYAAVRPYLADPPEAGDLIHVAAGLGLSANTVAVAVRRLRERLRALARAELATTLAPGADLDAELRWLRESLRNP